MGGSATNIEVKQGKKKSKERESPCEKEKEIPIPFDAEREKEIPSDLLMREGDTELENIEVRQQERKSKVDKEKEALPDAEMEKDAPPNDDICPICFENYNIPCKTNCGHWYCGMFLLCM